MGAVFRKLESIKLGKESLYSLIRSHLAEFIGTALLAVVGIGGAVMGHLTVDTPAYDKVTLTGRALANGLILSIMILNFGGISGAHFNPAVSLSFCLRAVYPWSKLLSYWVVQLGGAIAGAAIIRGIFPDNPGNDHRGRPLEHYGWTTALYVEILLTFVHILNILGTATRYQLIGTGTAFSVGGWVATSLLFTGPLSGAVLNPAIAFGAFVISGEWNYGWIYPVGEFSGALIAVAVTWILHPEKEGVEKSVAEGSEPYKDRHHEAA